MPYNDPDPSDPHVLVGVVLPADAEAMRDMAYAFAEEFARMGYNKKQLLSFFQNPFYAGANGAYRTLGEEAILSIVDECLTAWGGIQFSILDFGREPQSNDFGFSVTGTSEKDSVHPSTLREASGQAPSKAFSPEPCRGVRANGGNIEFSRSW